MVTKLANGGFSRRMFNEIAHQTVGTTVDLDAGTFSMPAGTYRIHAFSIITGLGTNQTPAPGYAVLLNQNLDVGENIHDKIVASGSIADASRGDSSVIDTIVTFKCHTNLTLEHQCRDSTFPLYTGLHDADKEGESTNHIFASITIVEME